jgi:TRAP-type C4-dicarboxylate transport system permease small subunit
MRSDDRRARAERIFRHIDRGLITVANISLAAILGTICWTVWMRYVMRAPVTWSEDLTSTAFAWFIFISMAAVHYRRDHVGIDVFTALLPAAAQRAVAWLAEAFMVIFCAYAGWLCLRQAVASWGTAETSILRIPVSFFFVAMVLGFWLMAARSVGYICGVPPIPREE